MHVNQNFGHSNLCLLFKACPMIKHISRRYFTEGLTQTHRTRGLSPWLPIDSIGTFYFDLQALSSPCLSCLSCISHCVLTHAFCSCQTLSLPFPWMCSFLSALSCSLLPVCLNLADCPRPSCHIYFVCGPALITHQTLSKFMWSSNNAISKVEVFWQIGSQSFEIRLLFLKIN